MNSNINRRVAKLEEKQPDAFSLRVIHLRDDETPPPEIEGVRTLCVRYVSSRPAGRLQ